MERYQLSPLQYHIPQNRRVRVGMGDNCVGPVLWAVDRGITSGTGNGRFSPGGTCTRGQIVTFLYRYFA